MDSVNAILECGDLLIPGISFRISIHIMIIKQFALIIVIGN